MSEQIENLLQDAQALEATIEQDRDFSDRNSVYRGTGEPRVIFKSRDLELTRDEEDGLVEWLFRRKGEIERELGVENLGEVPTNPNRFEKLRNKWMVQRELCDQLYEGDVDFRKRAFGSRSIFHEHNITLPMTRKIVQQNKSRAQNYFFDTEPWFSVQPVKQIDQDLAEKHEFFLRDEARNSNLRQVLSNEAMHRIFVNGEAVVKGTRQFQDDIYEELTTVAIDVETGEPLVAGDGDYIFPDDEWVALANPETRQMLNADLQPLQQGQEPVFVLKRHPLTLKPETLEFEERKVWRQLVHYEGADLDLVYWKDFLCPLRAKSIEEADVVCHLYDADVVDIVQRYMNATDGVAITDPRFLEMVHEMAGADGSAKSHDNQRIEDHDEDYANTEPKIQIGEFYCHYYVQGQRKNIMVVMDITNRRPIYYNYVARVTADGLRPLRCIRINPVENRWYGSSMVGLFWGLQELLDLTINRINKSQSDSGRVDFVMEEAIKEFEDNPHLMLNAGKRYTIKQGYNAKDVIFSHFLQNINHDVLRSILEIIQQHAQSLGGSMSANDADMAGLDTVKLATGIKHMERVNQEMFGPVIDSLIPGFQGALQMFSSITAANMMEPRELLMNRNGEKVTETITPQEVKAFDFKIELELTTYKGEQQLAQITLARELIKEFYDLPYPVQVVSVDIYRRYLKAIQIPNADQAIQPIDLGAQLPPASRVANPEMIEEALPQPDRG